MPLFEYKCPNGHVTEKLFLGEPDVDEIACKECGKTAQRVDISRTSFRLMPGGAGGFHAPSKG